jgi:hypothetical protein
MQGKMPVINADRDLFEPSLSRWTNFLFIIVSVTAYLESNCPQQKTDSTETSNHGEEGSQG